MKKRWQIISVLVALIAAIQAYAVVGQISHFLTIAWKTGMDSSGVIDAGRTMIYIFFGLSAMFIMLALISEEKLRKEESRFIYLSKTSSILLLSGSLIWASMLISPFVIISNR